MVVIFSSGCEENEAVVDTSDIDKDNLNGVERGSNVGGIFNKVNLPKELNRNGSSSPLFGVIGCNSNGSTAVSKQQQQGSSNRSIINNSNNSTSFANNWDPIKVIWFNCYIFYFLVIFCYK